jgi:hypothetical protein
VSRNVRHRPKPLSARETELQTELDKVKAERDAYYTAATRDPYLTHRKAAEGGWWKWTLYEPMNPIGGWVLGMWITRGQLPIIYYAITLDQMTAMANTPALMASDHPTDIGLREAWTRFHNARQLAFDMTPLNQGRRPKTHDEAMMLKQREALRHTATT